MSLSVAKTDMADDDPDVRELRLAFVCFAELLTARLADFHEQDHAALTEDTAPLPDEQRTPLLAAHLCFPVRDAVRFPINVFGDAGERDRVEVLRVSPVDVPAHRHDGEAVAACSTPDARFEDPALGRRGAVLGTARMLGPIVRRQARTRLATHIAQRK